MKFCCVCGKMVVSDTPKVLMTENQGNPKILCDVCAGRREGLTGAYGTQGKHAAVAYFREKMTSETEPEVRTYLNNQIKMVEADSKPQTPYTGTPRADVLPTPKASGWVSLMRLLVYVFLVVGVIAAIVLGVGIGDIFDSGFAGFVIAVVIIIIVFISCASSMIYLNMAEDINEIRQNIWNLASDVRQLSNKKK